MHNDVISNDRYATTAWVIRHPGGLYFGGFCDPRKNPPIKVKWVIGLCDARLFGGTRLAQAEQYINRIAEKDSLCVGMKAVEVRLSNIAE